MPNAPESGRRPPVAWSPDAPRPGAPIAPVAAPSDPIDPAVRHAEDLLGALGLPRAVPARPVVLGPALEWAGSGAMALTGEPEGPPRFAAGGLATAARGAGLALEALLPGAGFDRLDAPALLGERAALFGFGRRGRVSCGGSAQIVEARDAALAVNLPRDDDWRLLEAWLEVQLGEAAAQRDWTRVEAAIAQRAAAPLVERGREIGLAVALAPRAPLPVERPFRLVLETRCAPEPEPAPGPGPAIRRPRVLDLSSLWAGPLAGALLARAGFDVLKLESATRPDGARAGEPAFFDRLNAGKRSGSLDLHAADGRAVFARLLDSADVVIESARPRALAQLGFDASRWVTARPGRLWASITGHGRDEPGIAFGDDAAVAAGLAYDPPAPASRAPADPTPRFCGDAIADPLTGLYAAVAIAGLLAEGRGGLLSLALAEVAAHAARAGGDLPFSLPIDRRAEGWSVRDGDVWHAVAPPRAQSGLPTDRAPALRPLDAALLDDWTRRC